VGKFLTEVERKVPDRFVTNAENRPSSPCCVELQLRASVSGITAFQA
jgi:hypothetical protein